MSEEQSPTGKEGASADGRRRTHPMGRASWARSYVGTDLTRIVDQVTFAARSPVLEAVRQMQRSWVSPLIAQRRSALAALPKAALPKIETPSYVSQALLGGFAPAQVSMAEPVGCSLMAEQFVVRGLTNLTQAPALVGERVAVLGPSRPWRVNQRPSGQSYRRRRAAAAGLPAANGQRPVPPVVRGRWFRCRACARTR